MPFTAFHMGPGLALKAIGGRHFSLLVFGFTLVAMDVEPLVRMIRGDAVLHGFTHTYAVATVVAVLSLFLGRPICQWLLEHWSPAPELRFLSWIAGARRISWTAATTGAFVGAYSHVLLDSIMHSDMRPLWPLSDANALLHLVSVESLHLGCVASGLFGAVLLFMAYLLRRRASGNG